MFKEDDQDHNSIKSRPSTFEEEMQEGDLRCGFIAIMGRPNVGKSTLLNAILGEKISITSRKPQTTRHAILGVKTQAEIQMIFVDTPGLHQKAHRPANRLMNKAAREALRDVDLILFVVEGLKWTEEDEWVFSMLRKCEKPILLAVNKVDMIADKAKLLPHLQKLATFYPFVEIIPVSARTGAQVPALESAIAARMPPSPHFYPGDQTTDQSLSARIEEIIREKIVRILGQELPYTTTVALEMQNERDDGIVDIHAVIWVEREGQKPIVIGSHGARLKEIGMQARRDIERLLNRQVNLKLWVKIRREK